MLQEQLLNISGQAGVSAAGTHVALAESGYRYHRILRELAAATTVATCFPGTPSTRVNGTVQRGGITLTQLNGVNALNNDPSATYGTAANTPYTLLDDSTAAALIEEYLTEPWVPQFNSRQLTALDIFPGDVLSIETPYASIATPPTVKVFAEREKLIDVIMSGRQINRFDDKGNRIPAQQLADMLASNAQKFPGRPSMVKYSAINITPGGTTATIVNPNTTFQRQDFVTAIRIIDPTGGQTIDQAEVIINKVSQGILSKKQNGKFLRGLKMNPAAGFFDIVPNGSDDPRDGWQIGPTDQVIINLSFSASASTSVVGIIQRWGICD